MKLIATSDCHGKLSQALLPHGDVLILAGDMLANRSGDPDTDAALQLDALRELDAYCGTLAYKHVLMIAGNHDWVFERIEGPRHVLKNIVYLEDSGTEIEGVKFWGSPHQPWFYDWAFNHPRNGRALGATEFDTYDTDALITRPAARYSDYLRSRRASGVNSCQTRKEIEPRARIFGHIHGSYGEMHRW
jgi:Icc-related predicted phosphoesterase